MHLAYSAPHTTGKRQNNNKPSARYRGYLAACKKHGQLIAEIQQYLPGWQPLPPGPLKGELLRGTDLRRCI